MSSRNYEPIPLPSRAVIDAAVANARKERALALGSAFAGLGRALRRLWTKPEPLHTGVAAH
jgi:hypothetical protein